MERHRILLVTLLLLGTSLTGCLGSADDADMIRIAYSVKDDYDDADANPQTLADFIAAQTGVEVQLYPITSDGMALEALRFGHADIAFLDGGSAWLGWQQYGLDVIAADQDGRRFLYRPLIQRDDYVASESGRLVNRLFGGRISPLVAQLASQDQLTADDIAELEDILKGLKP